MLDVARSRVFREVAARGSFTGGNALHLSQPAVSHHVARLEEELGVQLLIRSPAVYPSHPQASRCSVTPTLCATGSTRPSANAARWPRRRPPRCGWRRFRARRGFKPNVISQTNDYLAMQGLVALGVGVALIPRLALSAGVRDGVALRPVEDPPLVRTTWIVRRSNGHQPLAAEPLRAILREIVPTLGASGLRLRRAQPVEG
jgi:DNA-binding transcriptional LysR family regulator